MPTRHVYTKSGRKFRKKHRLFITGTPMTTLVLVPGLVSDSIVWQPVADAVAGQMPVHHADLTQTDSIADMARGLLGAVSGPLIVVGHSLGGRVAMEMTRLAPDRVRGLVLANTGHHQRRDGEEIKRRHMIDLAHKGMDLLVDEWLPPMVDPARVADGVLMAKLRAMVLRANAAIHERQIRALLGRPNATAYLTTISCPVLLIVGRQDGWSPLSQHEEIAAAVRDAEIVVIENAGHFAPVERRQEVAAAITDWLARRFFAGHRTSQRKPPIPDTPLFDRAGSIRGYGLNKMAMSLGDPANRAAFKGNEEAYLDRFGLSAEEKAAVMSRDWQEMVRLGGNVFFILKISAIDPTSMTQIGAAQVGMPHEAFLKERLGKG